MIIEYPILKSGKQLKICKIVLIFILSELTPINVIHCEKSKKLMSHEINFKTKTTIKY